MKQRTAQINVLRMPRISAQLSLWYQSKTGDVLRRTVNRLMQQCLNGSCGYCAVELSMFNTTLNAAQDQSEDWFSQSNIKSHYHIGASDGDVIADFEHLPLEAESMDLVIAHHILEFTEPHQVLREIDRVLVPEGRVIIVAFNPFGMQGVKKLFARRQLAPWCGQFHSGWRVREWLSVLGFDIEYSHAIEDKRAQQADSSSFTRLCHFSRMCIPGFQSRLQNMFRNLIIISASKRVSRLTPIDSAVRQSGFVDENMVQPTTYTDACCVTTWLKK